MGRLLWRATWTHSKRASRSAPTALVRRWRTRWTDTRAPRPRCGGKDSGNAASAGAASAALDCGRRHAGHRGEPEKRRAAMPRPMAVLVRWYEEPALARRFGANYAAYRRA